ncbi:MAG: hypothetical protein QG650_897 [Patescibacteria group bacterium]|nr:hypothetical protein [Patescibacteria group bacterium]
MVEYPLPRETGEGSYFPNHVRIMPLRKNGAEKFPDDLETGLEIAGMEEELSGRIADSIFGIIDETDVSA